ncbi:MAG: enoyl-CoA hydratase/isomerase family protein [Actinomycetota bacterium]
MESTDVELVSTDDGSVAHLTIPGGPLTARTARELADAAASIRETRSIRVVTLAARGDFCSGPGDDLDVFDLRPDPASALAALRPPVVVGIDGPCLGEGLEVALAADLRLATGRSRFALDHLRRGRLPAWGGSQRLPRCVRPGTAVGLAMLGTELSADEARGLGLIHQVAEDLPTAMADVVTTLAARGPLALELTKEAVHRGSELPLRDGLRLEGDLNHQLAASEDRAEGLQAFFDRRPPDFGGR